MKSIKPGRGPSMMGGIVGIFMICFGILWTVLAAQANGFFALFGVLWTGIALVQTVYNFRNARGKNRYSSFDITDDEEEPDPLNLRYGVRRDPEEPMARGAIRYCPHCGARVGDDHKFCTHGGRELS